MHRYWFGFGFRAAMAVNSNIVVISWFWDSRLGVLEQGHIRHEWIVLPLHHHKRQNCDSVTINRYCGFSPWNIGTRKYAPSLIGIWLPVYKGGHLQYGDCQLIFFGGSSFWESWHKGICVIMEWCWIPINIRWSTPIWWLSTGFWGLSPWRFGTRTYGPSWNGFGRRRLSTDYWGPRLGISFDARIIWHHWWRSFFSSDDQLLKMTQYKKLMIWWGGVKILTHWPSRRWNGSTSAWQALGGP